MKVRKVLKKATAVVMATAFAFSGISFPTFVNPTNVKAETAKEPGNIPANAEVFFDANNEIQSFNVGSYWDVYDQYLLGNIVNKNNGLKLTSSTDGGIISGADTSQAAEVISPQTYQISMTGSNGDSATKTISGVSIPKNATVTLTGPGGAFVFGTLAIGSKTYNLSKAGANNGEFTANGTLNYHGTQEPWDDPSNTGGLSGFIDNASVTLSDAPVVYNEDATINLDGIYAAVDFTLTVTWEGEADFGGAVSTDGVFRVNYETGHQEKQYTGYQNSVAQQFGENSYYTDGTYTVVGWGGALSPSKYKEKFTFLMKTGDDTELSTILSYMNICVYNGTGDCLQTIPGSALTNDGTDGEYTKLSFVPTGGYDTSHIQGMKLYFNGTADYHRGTLLIKDVDVQVKDPDDYSVETINFGPFTYTQEDKFNAFFDKNDDSFPYLRVYQDGITGKTGQDLGISRDGDNTGTVAGYNISLNDTWHLWTMSTSDANIVRGNVNNMALRDALQIKYSNCSQHTTYTDLDGNVAKTGEWLAMTIKAKDLDPNIKLVLKKEGQVVKTLPIVKDGNDDSFVTTTDKTATDVMAADINAEYQTIYYHLNGNNENISFDSVSFDFSDVATSTVTSKYMYVSEIYLLNLDVQIEKEVKVNDGDFTKNHTTAKNGDTLTYQMTVKNIGATQVENVIVQDVVPAGLTYVSGGTCSEETNTVTWTIPVLNVGESTTVSFVATIDSDTKGMIRNTAKITSINGDEVNTMSNTVTTAVIKETPESFVYYAEVGQKTKLPMTLGITSDLEPVTSTKTVKDTYTITVPYSGDGNSGSKTINNIKIPAGAVVTITGPTSSFLMDKITLNDKGYSMSQTDIESGNNVEASATMSYVAGSLCGFPEGSYITLKNTGESEDTSITIDCTKLWNANQTFTLNVEYKVSETHYVGGEPTDDTIDTVPASTDNGATIEDNGMVGKNSGSLLYTSSKTGKDTFKIKVKKGSDAVDVTVTVYNYQVGNHVYVLDYGLPVDLTANDADNDNFLLNDATLAVEGANTKYSFKGLSDTKRNDNSMADDSDYESPYGVSGNTLNKKNGEVSYTYDDSNPESLNIVYTPTRFMDSVDTFYYGIQVAEENTTDEYDSTNATPVMEGKVDVMPANIVYYEDNFSQSGTTNTDPTKGIIYAGDSVTSNNTNFDKKQSNSLNIQYGYDKAYLGTQSSNKTSVKYEAEDYYTGGNTLTNNNGTADMQPGDSFYINVPDDIAKGTYELSIRSTGNRTQYDITVDGQEAKHLTRTGSGFDLQNLTTDKLQEQLYLTGGEKITVTAPADDAHGWVDWVSLTLVSADAEPSLGYSGYGATELGNKSMAAFEFKGTGFDIVSRTNDVTGAFIVKVFEKTKNGKTAEINNRGTSIYIKNGIDNLVKSMMIDTYYVDGDLYQIPVISWKNDDGKAKDYIVLVTSYARGNSSKTVYIDGIRIYNPITSGDTTDTGVGAEETGKVTDQYENIDEKNAQIKEARKMLFGTGFVYNYDDPLDSTFEGNTEITLAKFNGDFTGGNFLTGNTVVESVDANGNTTAPGSTAQLTRDMMAYAIQGPNNELYLSSGNGIGFYATENDETQKTLQLGLKVVTGTTHEVAYWTGAGWAKLVDLSSNKENYYKIDMTKLPYTTDSNGKKKYTFILKEGPTGSSTAENFISLTNIKVNGYDFAPLEENAMSRNATLKISNFKNIKGLDEQSGNIVAGNDVTYKFTTSSEIDKIVIKVNDNVVKSVRAVYSDGEDGTRSWTVKVRANENISSFDMYVYDSNNQYNVYTVTGKNVTEQ